MHKKIFASALVALICLLKGSESLFNGILANPGDFPYTVILGGRDGRVCGGSIISSSWVLTAAHCILFDNGTQMTDVSVEMGTEVDLIFTMEEEERDRRVEILVPHPDYNKKTQLHDIALLKVSPPFLWSREVLPIQLETNLTTELQGTAIISGYGETFHKEDFSIYDSRQLRSVKVPLFPKTCYENVKDPGNLTFCTFGRHSGACQGDSGSPVVFRGVQIGIAVLAADGCSAPASTIHIKVAAYIDWIQEKCHDCLAESEVFDVFSPEPVRIPTAEYLKYRVWVTSTKSIHVKPAASILEVEWMWAGSIISEFWVLTSNVSAAEIDGVSAEDLQLWVVPMAMEADKLEWVPVIRIIAEESYDIALAEVQIGFQWSETVAPVQLQLEPLNDSVTGEMLVWELMRDSTTGDESSEALVTNVNFASSADCSILLNEDQVEYLCGHVENLHGLQFSWHMGSPVVLKDGNQIGVSGEGNSTSPYESFDSVQPYIEWIQETCGGCLENYNEMTRQSNLRKVAIFSLFMTAVAVFVVAVCSLSLGVCSLVRRSRSTIAQAGRDGELPEGREVAYKFESRV